MNPKISVVIPVYNGELFISDAIESVLNQDYKAHEIIVIDDGSTDNTPKILEGFKDKIISRRVKNTGSPSIPRNIAMDMATGDYIAFLDADDVWLNNKLGRQVEFIHKYSNAGFFCCNFMEEYIDEKLPPKSHFNFLHYLNKINFDAPLKINPFKLLIAENFVGGASTVVIKKSVVDMVGEFFGGFMYGEDYDYWIRCAKVTDFVVISDVLMYKKLHSDNITKDSIVLHARHGDTLRKIMRDMSTYINSKGLMGDCRLAMSKNYCYLGNSYFEARKIQIAFKTYLQGLLIYKAPINWPRFIWAASKKLVRILTCDVVIRENITLRRLRLKYGDKINIKGKLLRLENYYNQAIYAIFNSEFKKEIPRLDGDRKSFGNLLLFLLNNVISSRFDADRGYFRRRFALQHSVAGQKSDTYEFIARTFIGVGYYLIHNESKELRDKYLTLIRNGTNPDSPFYWGRIVSNQNVVENASIIVGLLLNKEKLWDALSQKEKTNFFDYIKISSAKNFHKSNWLWFKILHLLLLEEYGGINYTKQIRAELKRIDSLYRGEGWYNDGILPGEYRYDHYNSWAMHYYGLLFCRLAGDKYSDIKEILKERFKLFKDSYIACLSEKNLPITWGRSILYRFAMLSCFGIGTALDLINPDEMLKIKKIAISTINEFFDNKILDRKGILTMGYIKASKGILESYSGEGSSYWALKAFSFLLLDENHPFWDTDLNSIKETEKEQENFVSAVNIYIRNSKDGHIFLVNAGMNSQIYPYKYNRFAYSNIFLQTLGNKFVDNAMTFFYRGKRLIKDIIMEVNHTSNNIMHVHWGVSKIKGLEAYTTVIPSQFGYILINNISSPETIKYIFSGFNIGRENILITKEPGYIELVSDKGISRLGVISSRKGKIGYKFLSGSAALNGRRSVLPHFLSEAVQGENRIIFCVQASPDKNIKVPEINCGDKEIDIYNYTDNMAKIKLRENREFFYE
ncbi:MAG: DUF2264 domain-containing protein [Candidatus Aureabacteria bacterium]|nr:DUF2264 domain-containing protein [Candidatus Auribacterota bacterium]